MVLNRFFPTSCVFLGVIALFLLFLTRVWTVIHFQEVHHLITSGFEEESLLAMWKIQHQLPIYTDVHAVPFTAAYFNWLFYAVYGSVISAVSYLFGLMDTLIPTVGRTMTVIIAILGFILNYRLLNGLNKTQSMMALCLSALLWLGPLIGFWAITVRPDLLALLFDLCALFFFLKFYPTFKLRAIIWAALFCYCSWATKQINIIMPGAIGLYLLLQKDKHLIVFSCLLGAMVGFTFLFASSPHLKMLLFLDTAVPLSLNVMLTNLLSFGKKTIPLWLGMLTLGGVLIKQRPQGLWQNRPFMISVCGILAWSIVMLPASSKVGSAENYYFILMLFLTLMLMSLLPRDHKSEPILKYGIASMGLAMIFSAYMAYHQNKGMLQAQHQNYTQLKACIDSLPPPVFVINHYGALPWMNPHTPPFVLAYNYWNDRKANRTFESNGVGGLIALGFFNSLILPRDIQDNFDAASLSAFNLKEVPCMGYKVFVKTSLS